MGVTAAGEQRVDTSLILAAAGVAVSRLPADPMQLRHRFGDAAAGIMSTNILRIAEASALKSRVVTANPRRLAKWTRATGRKRRLRTAKA
jgi:hypothetical protein